MVIGITGGIGSGKSAVCEILQIKFNAYFLKEYDIAKEIMLPGTEVFRKIVDFFGKDILAEDGSIESGRLGEIVFNNPEKLEKLNSFVHCEVFNNVMKQINEIKSTDKNPLIVVESALPEEAAFEKFCDEIWVVLSTLEDRIGRLKEKRNYSGKKALSVINRQMADEEFAELADFVIYNTGTKEDLDRIVTERLVQPENK